MKRLKWFYIPACIFSVTGVFILLAPVFISSPLLANELLLIILCITGFVIFQIMAILLFLTYKNIIMKLLQYKQNKETSFSAIVVDNLKLHNAGEIMKDLKGEILNLLVAKKKSEENEKKLNTGKETQSPQKQVDIGIEKIV